MSVQTRLGYPVITAKISKPQRVNQTELYFPLTLDVQHMLTRAWLIIATQGPRLMVVPSQPMLSWLPQSWEKNEMNCKLSPKTSLAKASHTATSNFNGDRMCSSAMSLKEDPFVDLVAFSTRL